MAFKPAPVQAPAQAPKAEQHIYAEIDPYKLHNVTFSVLAIRKVDTPDNPYNAYKWVIGVELKHSKTRWEFSINPSVRRDEFMAELTDTGFPVPDMTLEKRKFEKEDKRILYYELIRVADKKPEQPDSERDPWQGN